MVIDLDRMDAQLDLALTDVVGDPPVEPGPGAGVRELLELGRLDEVDALVASTTDRLDSVMWRTMRALLDGRRDAVRSGLDELRALTGAGHHSAELDRYWAQRFWAAVEWGSEAERFEVLDHCRARAYRFDDLRWWGNLTLLLSTLGKGDEATRAFDATADILGRCADAGLRLDAVTNLIEGAALLGDAGRVTRASRWLAAFEGRLVIVGAGEVCKGSVDRYLALGFAAQGRWADAGRTFRSAAAAHRAMGAAPLLARTLQQAAQASVAA